MDRMDVDDIQDFEIGELEALSDSGETVDVQNVFTEAQMQTLGLESVGWQTFLNGFASRAVYDKRARHFLCWYVNFETHLSLEDAVVQYFLQHYEHVDENGLRIYSPTTLRSWLSVLVKFWEHTGRGNLKAQYPIIETKLAQWDKAYKQTQAKVFTLHDLERLYNMPNSAELLVLKAFAVIAVSCAGRNCELCHATMNQLERIISQRSNEINYKFSFQRTKQQGVISESHSLIVGAIEVGILDQYVGCFPIGERSSSEKRLFRKLTDGDGLIYGTNVVIGKNTLSNYGKKVAGLLELPDPHRYTGHSWRRSAATIGVNAGMSHEQIKNMTGHRSDTAVRRYVEESEVHKEIAGHAVAVGVKRKGTYCEAPMKKKCSQQKTKSSSVTYNINVDLSNTVINAPMSFIKPQTAAEGSSDEEQQDENNIDKA